MANEGWIKLHRKLLDNPIIMKDSDHFFVWVYLLLNATHTEHKTLFCGKPIILHPGQVITGRKKIARETKINEHKVDRILKALKSEHQIEQQTSSHGSVISILRWNDYQNIEQQNEPQVSNNRATSEQQVSTIQECKELKNDKNVKNSFKAAPPEGSEVKEAESVDNFVNPHQAFIDANRREKNEWGKMSVEERRAIIKKRSDEVLAEIERGIY